MSNYVEPYTGRSEAYQYNRTFSGTDTLAFIMLPGVSPIVIGSITTISYSVFRNKKPVINIGRTNINGLTRGSRIFAGTMVFTLINQHWVREISSHVQVKDWLGKYDEIMADELPLFDIMIVSANEYGAYCSMFIYGIDITDEGQTISIEDLFTENVFQFVARDISTFKGRSPMRYDKPNNTIHAENKFYVVESRVRTVSTGKVSREEIDNYVREKVNQNNKLKIEERQRLRVVMTRTLYPSRSRTFTGNDVLEIQTLLNAARIYVNESGVYDENTVDAVKEFQSKIGVTPDGIVDTRLYHNLLNYTDQPSDNSEGYVINKSGTFVYKNPDKLSTVVNVLSYKDSIRLFDYVKGTDGNGYFRINEGYIAEEDVFDYRAKHNTVELPPIKYLDKNMYVNIVKSALNDIYPGEVTDTSSTFDYVTESLIKRLQSDNGVYPNGVVNNDTWLLLQQLSNNVSSMVRIDNYTIAFNILPNTYDFTPTLFNDLSANIDTDRAINVKLSTIRTFSDGTVLQDDKTILADKTTNINFRIFADAFSYEPTKGEEPSTVELIMYPLGLKPYKWTFNNK